jgi:hypothetical protein
MVRKQVYITREQSERLRRVAARERRTEAEVLRDALDRHLGVAVPVSPKLADDSLWDIVGVASSDRRDLSESVDQVLYEAFTFDHSDFLAAGLVPRP